MEGSLDFSATDGEKVMLVYHIKQHCAKTWTIN